jgi:catechol 2,3-dioxygenase-like lactoylglutathione lyase family enzyme
MVDIAGVYHLSLSVRDIQKSVAWYKDLLGLQQLFETISPEHGWVKIGLYHPASQTRLHFAQHQDGSAEPFSEFRAGLDHIAFRVPGGRAALETWLSRLAQRGVDHSPIKKAGQGEVITFRDPDNIQLELYATNE